MDENTFGFYADEVIYYLKASNFANEYYYMSNSQRLRFLNEILQILGYYGEYDLQED
jgi:hypothetical protein